MYTFCVVGVSRLSLDLIVHCYSTVSSMRGASDADEALAVLGCLLKGAALLCVFAFLDFLSNEILFLFFEGCVRNFRVTIGGRVDLDL